MATDGTDDLLQPSTLSPSTRSLLSAREGSLSPRIVEAVRELNLPEADNVTVVSFDWC